VNDMGKRIISRARGKGGPRYRSPGHRFQGKIKYPVFKEQISGKIEDLVHDSGRTTPLASVAIGDKKIFVVAAEGVSVGDNIVFGATGNGNVAPLKDIEEGTSIFCIENRPGSGPKLCRTSGTFATLMSKTEEKVYVKMPSGKFRFFNSNCLATIGKPGSGGRKTKPFVKAGQKFYMKNVRNKLWPKTSAVAMNPVDHPFGGKTKPGKSKSVSRHAPPGRKVGDIASKRTGKRKR